MSFKSKSGFAVKDLTRFWISPSNYDVVTPVHLLNPDFDRDNHMFMTGKSSRKIFKVSIAN